MTDMRAPLACVLFDLDGTLVDTAPDLLASLDACLLAHGYSQPQAAAVRPHISRGALAMLEQAAAAADAEMQQRLLTYMLDHYQQHIAVHSRLYPGMAETLLAIEAMGLKWGVVTNKRQRFTGPLLTALELERRTACIVSGDTTAFSKPHPAPLFAACVQAGVEPENCVYLGDAAHDITAGRSAGMQTLVAAYGYLHVDDRPEDWGADGLISHPGQLLKWIEKQTCH